MKLLSPPLIKKYYWLNTDEGMFRREVFGHPSRWEECRIKENYCWYFLGEEESERVEAFFQQYYIK